MAWHPRLDPTKHITIPLHDRFFPPHGAALVKSRIGSEFPVHKKGMRKHPEVNK